MKPAVRATALAVLAAALALLASCSEPQGQPRWQAAGIPGPRRGGSITIATAETVPTLDPAVAYNEISTYLAAHLFDTLLGYPPALDTAGASPSELVPLLAESYQVLDGGTRLRFALRPGLRYADGTPILASHFVFALERVLTTAASPFASFLRPIVGAQELRDGKAKSCTGLRALDERTLEITLSGPDASFLYVLAMKFSAPLSPEHAARVGDELRRHPLASGAYSLQQWQEGRRVVLHRNPHHWDTRRGWIEEITFLENVPRDIELLLFERGELDTCYQPSAPGYLWLTRQAAWAPHLRRLDLMISFGERMNVTRPPFDDVRVRRALNYAVNKDHLIRLLYGTATPSHGLLPPGMFGRATDLTPYPHDPAKARALLAEAGYPKGFDLDYTTLAGDEPRKLAASLQADLAEVGVRLHVRELSFPAYLASVGSRQGPPFSFSSWIQDYPDPTSFVDLRFHSRMISDEAAVNDTFYANPEVDALIDRARAEQDRNERARLYQRIEHLLYRDVPWIWGYHRAAIEAVQPYLKAYQPHPVWLRDYSYAWLDLDDQGRRVPAKGAP